MAILSRKPLLIKNTYYIVGCLELAVIFYPVHIFITIFILFLSLVTFDSGESTTVNMFVTLLNSSCSVILGYNWLTHYNPSIDRVLGSITFYPHLLESPTPSPMSSAKKAQLPSQNSTIPETLPIPATPNLPSIPLCIALIGAAAFAPAYKQPGVQSFKIHLSDPLFSAKSALVSNEAPDLSNVPEILPMF